MAWDNLSMRTRLGAAFGVVVLLVASPEFMDPYDSLGGQLVLLVAGALFVGAVWSLMVMSRPVPVPRVLAGIEEVPDDDWMGAPT